MGIRGVLVGMAAVLAPIALAYDSTFKKTHVEWDNEISGSIVAIEEGKFLVVSGLEKEEILDA
jgi:hypothetical protein